jgi:hypothetical protein
MYVMVQQHQHQIYYVTGAGIFSSVKTRLKIKFTLINFFTFNFLILFSLLILG